jgi:DNA-binding transcriptional regulator YiaG
MTPAELRELSAGWPSVSALAVDLGVTRAAVYYWLAGDREIPEPAARLVRLLYRHPKLRDEVG